jgi:hypothetical protein
VSSAGTRRIVLIRGSALPFDVSPARLRALASTGTQKAARRSSPGLAPLPAKRELAAVVQRQGRNLDVSCALGGLLEKQQLQALLVESATDARWASIEAALDGGARPVATKAARASKVAPTALASGGGCGGHEIRSAMHRLDRSTRRLHTGSTLLAYGSMGECGCGGGGGTSMRANLSESEVLKGGPKYSIECEDPPMMATVSVTATPDYVFLSLDTIVCLVFGKCANFWGVDDPWWGLEDLWVHYDGLGDSGGAWGAGASAPTSLPTPEEENATLCAAFDEEFGLDIEALAGAETLTSEETDPFCWSIWRWSCGMWWTGLRMTSVAPASKPCWSTPVSRSFGTQRQHSPARSQTR